MRINNNIMAMNTHRQLGIGNTNGAKSMEKLSSGFRINRAGDDAAGLAMSEKMRGQIRGLNQASRNAQDGISLVQTAEGALSETQAILQRMRELAVQASNDTNVGIDRGEIQKEINQLSSEIDRISNTTEFNTQRLLNGGLGAVATSSLPANVSVVSASGLKLGAYTATVDTAAVRQVSTGATTYLNEAAIVTANFVGKDISLNGIKIDFTGTSRADVLAAFNARSAETGFTATNIDGGGFVFTATEFGAGKSAVVTGANAALIGTVSSTTAGVNAVMTLRHNTDLTSVTVTGEGRRVVVGTAEFTAAGVATSNSIINVVKAGSSIHIGANTGQTMLIDINAMSTTSLGNTTNKIDSVSVMDSGKAGTAIKTINDAIEQVSAERSKLGAFQNRLEHSIKNLDTSAENMQASESRIRDVDMAKEMMEFTKNNILTQAATAMLAQANQAPQGVLQLLR
ncbi:MAG: flagellin [Bacillota bacterium]|nr:MAG: flagellin [Bacillota bacterium]